MKSNLERILESLLSNLMVLLFGLFMSALILSFFVMWLWNGIVPSLFGLRGICYWDAFKLYYLSGLLVKSITIAK